MNLGSEIGFEEATKIHVAHMSVSRQGQASHGEELDAFVFRMLMNSYQVPCVLPPSLANMFAVSTWKA